MEVEQKNNSDETQTSAYAVQHLHCRFCAQHVNIKFDSIIETHNQKRDRQCGVSAWVLQGTGGGVSKNGTFSCAVIKYSSKSKPSSPSFFSLYLLHNSFLLTTYHNFLFSTFKRPKRVKETVRANPSTWCARFL